VAPVACILPLFFFVFDAVLLAAVFKTMPDCLGLVASVCMSIYEAISGDGVVSDSLVMLGGGLAVTRMLSQIWGEIDKEVTNCSIPINVRENTCSGKTAHK
jgi:hypothetical protein